MKWIIQEEKEEDHLQILNKDSEIGIDEVGRGSVFGPIFFLKLLHYHQITV